MEIQISIPTRFIFFTYSWVLQKVFNTFWLIWMFKVASRGALPPLTPRSCGGPWPLPRQLKTFHSKTKTLNPSLDNFDHSFEIPKWLYVEHLFILQLKKGTCTISFCSYKRSLHIFILQQKRPPNFFLSFLKFCEKVMFTFTKIKITEHWNIL